jgi:hypothetical protein
MTEQNKADVNRLRLAGYSYTQIAEILHLSRNTVKSVCQRWGIQPEVTLEAGNEAGLCQNCGIKIVQTEKRKQRNFCSDSCRRAWWKAHRDSGKKKTAVQVRCISWGDVEDYTRNLGSIAAMPAMFKIGLGREKRMTDMQFELEMRYRTVMAVARTMLARGLITRMEFEDFDRKMTDKYNPFYVCLSAKTPVDKI